MNQIGKDLYHALSDGGSSLQDLNSQKKRVQNRERSRFAKNTVSNIS